MADILLSELTNSDIDWLSKVGEQQHLSAGTRFSSLDDSHNANFYVVLDGCMANLALDPPELADTNRLLHETARLSAGEGIGTAYWFKDAQLSGSWGFMTSPVPFTLYTLSEFIIFDFIIADS